MTALQVPALAPDASRVRSCLESVAELLDSLGSDLIDELDVSDAGALASDVTVLAARMEELRLRVLAAAADSDGEVAAADSDPAAWLARLTGTTRAAMAGGLHLASALQDRYPQLREAFAVGALDQARVRVIVKAADAMPNCVTDSQRVDVVDNLTERAIQEGLDASRLRRAVRRMCERISREVADTHEASILADEERRAECNTALVFKWLGDGRVTGTFEISEFHAGLLSTALAHLSAPRRLSRNKADELVTDQSAETVDYYGQLGAAFCELIEHLPTDGWSNHGRVGATVMVHLDHQNLLDGLGAGHLDSGQDIGVDTVRRLACNAGIVPAVFGGKSVPLDLGRSARLHTTQQRAALSAAYDTCAAEGCQRPFSWTEIHHKTWWSAGGHTDLDNGVPLCGFHHRRAHDPHYRVTHLPTGEVRFRHRKIKLPAPDTPHITVHLGGAPPEDSIWELPEAASG